MQLYKDKERFDELVSVAANELKIPAQIIEKDYFVTIVLKKLSEKLPNLLFKGGTSLSKCYDIIKRFSEDIDLTIIDEFTQSNRQKVKRAIESVCGEFEFEIVNLNDTKSKRCFNKYEIDYKASFDLSGLKNNLYIETVFIVKTFPTIKANVDNLLYRFLKLVNREDLIEMYELQPFVITTQSIERTFVDKVFAICDYYISNNIKEHSRHIYDLYKIMSKITFDDNFQSLVQDVREVRKINKQCYSAQDGQNINKLLNEIIDKDIYKKDYTDITQKLLYENVDYDTAISVVKELKKKNIF